MALCNSRLCFLSRRFLRDRFRNIVEFRQQRGELLSIHLKLNSLRFVFVLLLHIYFHDCNRFVLFILRFRRRQNVDTPRCLFQIRVNLGLRAFPTSARVRTSVITSHRQRHYDAFFDNMTYHRRRFLIFVGRGRHVAFSSKISSSLVVTSAQIAIFEGSFGC